jgi:hypothetical protein
MIEAKVGKVREYDGQRYECIGFERYERRRDGAMSKLALWRSSCAQCRAPFVFKTPKSIKRFEPNRRCPKHRQPGMRVPPVVRRKSAEPTNRVDAGVFG